MAKSRAPGGGRKPTPTALKKLTGSKRPQRSAEAEPDAGIPPPPRILQGDALAEWKRVTPLLLECGLVSHIDRAALTTYCLAWGRMCEAEEALRQHGIVIMSPKKYPVASPYLAIANKAREEMMRALCEFGMTPSSRTKIDATPPKPRGMETDGKRAEFFGSA